ncbi:MAG: hypothetical protein R3C10_01130 [Pirellulales bacterium]
MNQTRDIALDDLMVPATVFANNRLTVGGLVRTSGYTGEQIPIELLFETTDGTMRRVATRTIASTGDGQQRTVQLEHVPTLPGEYKLTLRIPPREGEMVTTNNEPQHVHHGAAKEACACFTSRGASAPRWAVSAAPSTPRPT